MLVNCRSHYECCTLRLGTLPRFLPELTARAGWQLQSAGPDGIRYSWGRRGGLVTAASPLSLRQSVMGFSRDFPAHQLPQLAARRLPLIPVGAFGVCTPGQ